MNVQAHAAEGSTTADSATQTISVTVTPVSESPVLASTAAVAVPPSVNEVFFFNDTATPEIYTLPLPATLPTFSNLTAGASLSNTLNGTLTPTAGVYTLS